MRRLKNVLGLLGTIIKWFGVLYIIPLLFALFYGAGATAFIVPMFICLALGWALEKVFPGSDLEVADGFLLVILTWFGVSWLGALPYIIHGVGNLSEPINAFFESASGFTCTGSTIMDEISVEKYSHAIMIWRQMTQWIGGMGILVLAVAVLPRLSVGGVQFLDNEVPGPKMDRLTPHMAETARRLWVLYIGLSVVLFLILLVIGLAGLDPVMTPYQAFAHALTTIPSGGFSPLGRSAEALAPIVQWILVPFMLIAAVNFTLLWFALFKGPRVFWRDTEFKVFMAISMGAGTLLGALLLGADQYPTAEENFRHGFFQMATFISTTGFASTDFAEWKGDSHAILLLLMPIAGCVGSTSGGPKVLRWIIAFKVIVRELVQQIHPSAVRPLRVGERVLHEDVVKGAMIFLVTYLILFVVSVGVLAVDLRIAGIDLPIEDIASAVTATLGNIGPGYGAVGPMAGFGFFPVFSKIWMCVLMIAGRLEVMTLLVLLSPWYWRD
ncbi:TrkH family potassium uptake protein [Microvenator marinus]|uniref:TrkH family potassium uptake protein n=1 Tax=Microvenator marinus TaxID=2600177 RepID=A0A5B8XTN8_9DELT|nr:TrkH family potassium uptake protein [Microvenator marinus]QED29272.1 TrkH family potassium uptake protein [Microvenator marinus]